jgi:hypothetical protein
MTRRSLAISSRSFELAGATAGACFVLRLSKVMELPADDWAREA